MASSNRDTRLNEPRDLGVTRVLLPTPTGGESLQQGDPFGNTVIRISDSFSMDPFCRLRSSTPQTLFSSKMIHDNLPLYWDDVEFSGSGTTSVFSSAKASDTMSVASSTVGIRIRQTFQRFNYQTGKGQWVIMTGVLRASGGGSGIVSRFGVYDGGDGIFFEDKNDVTSVAIRSSVSGSPVDTVIPQTEWNLDAMDGNGPSGFTLDITKQQIFVTDFEWLGSGRVRVGFMIDGIIQYVHQFLHANVIDTVYMSTPNLPLRYEIINDGTGQASSMTHQSSSVISEGGEDDVGILRYASTSGVPVAAATAGVIYAVVGIRLRSDRIDMAIDPVSVSMVNAAIPDFEWLLILNPTIDDNGGADPFTYTELTDSAVEAATGVTANTVTGGITCSGGQVKGSASTGMIDAPLNTTNRIGASILGVRDEIVLCVRPFGNNASIHGSLNWRELS